MPQTREHLAILDLLEVRRGLVVITKKDLVDEELLSLVRMEVEELLSGTTLAKAPLVAVSALTGDGLPELVATIDRLLSTTEPRRDLGRPRLPIDRVFTMAGSGTVVTGTLIDGSLTVGEEVEIVPQGLKSRLRGLQTHKTRLNTAEPGSRVAANLVGVTTAQLHRGDVLTRPGWLTPTALVSVKLSLLGYLRRPLRHGTTVSFHTGAAEAMAKVRLLEAEQLALGKTAWAQIALNQPLAAVKGDHFIIRSPMETLGGGRIIDAHPRRLRRFRPDVLDNLKAREEGTAEDMVLAFLEGKPPVELSALTAQFDLTPDETRSAVQSLVQQKKIMAIGQGNGLLMTASGWDRMAGRIVAAMEDYHRQFPARPGMPRVELGSRLKLGASSPDVFRKLVEEGTVVEEGGAVRLPYHKVRLSTEQQSKMDAFLRALEQNPYSPPTDNLPGPELLNLLTEQGKVIKASEDVVFSSRAYQEMTEKITSRIKERGQITLAEVRDLFQTSRKYAQAILEYLDRKKITRRVGDVRVLY